MTWDDPSYIEQLTEISELEEKLAEATARAEAAELRLKGAVQAAFDDACKAICQYCKYNYGYVGPSYLSHAVDPEFEDNTKIYWCDAHPIRNIAAVKGLKGEEK